MPPQRRRIDRVAAPDLLEGLPGRPLEEVRALRDEAREEESRLSFHRRLVQARLDIVRAAITRREAGDDTADTRLLGDLPEVLADEPPPSPRVELRATPMHAPDDAGRRGDDVLADPSLGRLPDLDVDALHALADRLADEERKVSALRARVIEALDGLQGELVRRYAQDPAAVEQALARAVDRARLG